MQYYNTGKVKIGINYKPRPYIETDPDMLRLQLILVVYYFLVNNDC